MGVVVISFVVKVSTCSHGMVHRVVESAHSWSILRTVHLDQPLRVTEMRLREAEARGGDFLHQRFNGQTGV